MMEIKSKKGSVLVIAAILSFAAVSTGVSFLAFVASVHHRVNDEIASAQTFYDRLEQTLSSITGSFDAPEDISEINYGSSVKFVASHSYYASSRKGSKPEKPAMNERHESFADFLYLSSRERDSVRHVVLNWWGHDTLDGPMHSNDTLHIQPNEINGPVFWGRVTSSCGFPSLPPDSCNPEIFRGGCGYHPRIVFPDRADAVREYADYTFATSTQDSLTQLVISGNHIYHRKCGLYHRNDTDSLRCDPATIAGSPYVEIPENKCIFVDGKCMISAARGMADLNGGQFPERPGSGENFISEGLSGRLTIGSSDTMIIGDNIIYAHSRPDNSVPSTMDSCSDMLGLVSERYIMISRLARSTTYINAGLAAIVGSFSVQDIYWNQPPGWDNEKQALYVYGSIAQRNRGIMHTTDNPPGHLRGFIEKKYHYDVRFPENHPFAFPPARTVSPYKVSGYQEESY